MIKGPSVLTLPAVGLDALEREAVGDGHRFVTKFIRRWVDGSNRFDKPGEKLLGFWQESTLIAFGGVNVDPYLDDPSVGRLRHLYVAREYRDRGIGRSLTEALLEDVRQFVRIRLRAGTDEAAKFYDRLGWQGSDESDATHVWKP